MKTKTKRIIKIIIIVLIALLVISGVVCLIVIPQQLTDFGLFLWDKVNQPLPVVGVSSLVIGMFAWRIFASTSFGKRQLRKVNEEFANYKEERKQEQKEREEFENNVKELVDSKQKEINYLKEIIKQICDLTPNKKIKAIGEQIYGKETNDSSAETKDL